MPRQLTYTAGIVVSVKHQRAMMPCATDPPQVFVPTDDGWRYRNDLCTGCD